MSKSKKEIATIASIIGLLISAFLVSFAYELGNFEDEYLPPNQYQPNKVLSIKILSFLMPISQIAIAFFLSMIYFEERTLLILLSLCGLVLMGSALFSAFNFI